MNVSSVKQSIDKRSQNSPRCAVVYSIHNFTSGVDSDPREPDDVGDRTNSRNLLSACPEVGDLLITEYVEYLKLATC